MCDTCKNDVVIRVKKHSMEINPQVFQVVKEKPSLVSFQEREQKLIRHCACQKGDSRDSDTQIKSIDNVYEFVRLCHYIKAHKHFPSHCLSLSIPQESP